MDLLHYIYNYYHGYASCLPQSLCPSTDFFVICCDHDLWLHVWHDHDLWLLSHLCDSVMVMWYFPMLHPSNKEKKRKEILNNDLVVLPSHDISSMTLPCGHNRCYLPVLYTFQTWLCCHKLHLAISLSILWWFSQS